MSHFNIQAAATKLLSLRVAGMKSERLNEDIRPLTIEDALQVQSAMVEQHDDTVGGWKCLFPISDVERIIAPIFSKTVQRGASCEFFRDNGVARIEPEIAFVLDKDLPANADGYTEEQIKDAIGSCHMALELMQERFAEDSGIDFPEKMADCLVNQGLFIGPEIDRDKAFDTATIDITITQPDNTQTFAGEHPNASAHKPVYWLIDTMTRRGINFNAGEAIITGSFCGIVEVEFDKPTTVSYAGLGEYEVGFIAK